jgi:hypothetical protein
MKSWWLEFAIGMTVSAALCMLILGLFGEIDERDRRIARLEAARSGCVPVREREIASAHMRRDGSIECAITSRVNGRRAEIYRMTY